ncbi:14568_t:CDS:2, partial [Cetraspora pellucida]
HDGKRIEVPISSNGTKKLEVPEERDQPGSDSGDEFGEYTYEDEELVEAEGYYTEEAIDEIEELFYNPWEGSTSPALYLTNVEEMPTREDEEPELTVEGRIEQFLQNETLNTEDKSKAAAFFRRERTLFASDIQELGETNVITHRIETGIAKPIKQKAYRAAPSEHEFIERELKEMEKRGLIRKYMAIKESGKEELVTENVEEQANEKQPNLPKFEEHLALEVLDRRKAIYTIEFHGFNLIASEPRQLLVLRDWVITGAEQELIRREYLRNTGIDLGYTEPLNLQEIKKEKNANWRGDRKVVTLESGCVESRMISLAEYSQLGKRHRDSSGNY